ncbi:glucose-fructose oxidoreductase domain-containing protein 2-like [Artemia franciscana]|uniref:Glucose-fructose oxidoreductase domain-containing protein 1 n=1 Tax=Artemia franciscana TaxID=6661 RepID=A0AA88ILK1_ARTSF|nr:hypothetical protein QYM36_003250 [Artemia franciscana]
MLLEVGIIGTSKPVKFLVTLLRAKGFQPVAVCGNQLNTAKKFAEEADIPFYTSNVEDILLRSGVDIIFILCPPSMQAQIANKALSIGKHVVCDRPCGLQQADALKMANAAQYYPSLIGIVSYGMRFDPILQKMQSLILSSFIGQIMLISVDINTSSLVGDEYSWLCDENSGGGILTVICSHFIDAISFITGKKLRQVHGSLRTLVRITDKINGIRQITSDDFCSFQGEINGGAFLSVTANSNMSDLFKYNLVITGSKGYLSTDGKILEHFNSETKEKSVVAQMDTFTAARDLNDCKDYFHLLCPSEEGLSRFVNALKESFQGVEDRTGWNKDPVAMAATFEDGQYVQAVIEAVRKSSRLKEWVSVTSISEAPDPNPLISAAVKGVQRT